jgi:hypothetical protein
LKRATQAPGGDRARRRSSGLLKVSRDVVPVEHAAGPVAADRQADALEDLRDVLGVPAH